MVGLEVEELVLLVQPDQEAPLDLRVLLALLDPPELMALQDQLVQQELMVQMVPPVRLVLQVLLEQPVLRDLQDQQALQGLLEVPVQLEQQDLQVPQDRLDLQVLQVLIQQFLVQLDLRDQLAPLVAVLLPQVLLLFHYLLQSPPPLVLDGVITA